MNNEPHEQLSAADLRWSWLFAATSWIIGLSSLAFLPESVPVHWGLSGEPDRFGSPLETGIALPLSMTFTLILLIFAARIDPNRNVGRFRAALSDMMLMICAFMLYIQICLIMVQAGLPLSIRSIFPMGFGLLFIGVGNLLPRLRQNLSAGVRTPWTLQNEEVWLRTNLLVGRGMMVFGLLSIISAWLPPLIFVALMLGVLPLLILVAVLYSYLEYRRLAQREES